MPEFKRFGDVAGKRALFTMTGKTPLTITRKKDGLWVDGDWIEGGDEVVEIEANVQPMKGWETQNIKEAYRSSASVVLYTLTPLKAVNEEDATLGDEFVWKGYKHTVVKVETWEMGVLDHTKAYAVKSELADVEAYIV